MQPRDPGKSLYFPLIPQQNIQSRLFLPQPSLNVTREYRRTDWFALKQSSNAFKFPQICNEKSQVMPLPGQYYPKNRPSLFPAHLTPQPDQCKIPFLNCPYLQKIVIPGKSLGQCSTSAGYWPPIKNIYPHENPYLNPINGLSHQTFLISSEMQKNINKTSPLEKSENREEEKIKDFSLSKIHKKLSCELSLEGKACKRRNVHKSIIRHMDFYVMNNYQWMTNILTMAGYSISEIEQAYQKVKYYHNSQREKGFKRMAQSIVRNIVAKKNIFTFILRETLREWLEKLEEGKVGRITKEYLSIYKNTISTFYAETIKVISEQYYFSSCQ